MTREEKYQEESNVLFESFLERYFYAEFRGEVGTPHGRAIELFIRGVCPSNCKYCYLIKHSKELYPLDCQDEKTILTNLRSFCEWYIEKKFKTNIVFFTGEIVKSGLLFKILDIFLEYFSDKTQPYRPRDIICPENCDFINDAALTEKMQQYIDKFKEIDIQFALSLSVDGKMMDVNRDKEHSDEYYKRLSDFADRNFFGFHPMVSAFNIGKWKENFDWWTKSGEIAKAQGNYLMMLEVRDNNWTDEAVNQYLDFLNYVIDEEYKKYGDDKLAFATRVFKHRNILSYYDNIGFGATYGGGSDYDISGLSCSVQKNLCIRLGDMAIVPCHRTSYEQFVTGFFKRDENNKIIGYECKNLEALIAVYNWNKDSSPWCCDCDVKYWCPGPCLGSDFESSGDMFKPPETVCKLFHARSAFLLMKYEEMGILDCAEKNNLFSPREKLIYENYKRKLRSGMQHYDKILRDAIDAEETEGGRASTVRVKSQLYL